MAAQLIFNVDGQTITRLDDFRVVAKSENYLRAQFTFTADWGSGTKTAQFVNSEDPDSVPYEAILDTNGECEVPWEAHQYDNSIMTATVFDGTRITTNAVEILVRATGYRSDGGHSTPNPDVYQQILNRLDDVEQTVADKATEAESWAVGGTDTRTGEDTDNAKYYAEQAGTKATEAATSATQAAGSATAASGSATEAATSASTASRKARDAAATKDAIDGIYANVQTSESNARTAASAAEQSAREASQTAATVESRVEDAENSASSAAQAATDAQASAEAAAESAGSIGDAVAEARTYASRAEQSASNASTSASSASRYSGVAQQAATTANGYASDAANAAGDANGYAGAALQSKNAAETAQGIAETAATDATTAKTAAETAAASVTQSAAQIAQNTSDITDLKSNLNELTDRVIDIGDNTTLGLYGAKWDRLTNRLTRLFQAADITTDTTNFCHKGTINANYDNPFDGVYPWSEMFVCNVDLTKYRNGDSLKDCITAAYGDPDFTYEGSETNFVGRYRPEFWYKSEEDADGNVYFLVSQIERTGFERAPEAIDGISFCIDAGNSKVTAGSGIPLTNIAMSQIHARAKSSGFALQDIYTIDQQIILCLVEYANMNIQNAIGDGCSSCYRENDVDVISNVVVGDGETVFDVTDSAMAQYMQVGCQIDIGTSRGAVTYRGLLKSYSANGTTYTIALDRELAVTDGMIASVHGFSACEYNMTEESIGSASGYIGTAGKVNAFYRGALLYANRYSYTLGIYRQTGTNHLWLCPKDLDPNDYDALNTTVHSDTGVALPTLSEGAWQTVGGNAQRIEGLSAFMATGESSGSSASPVGDQQYVPISTAGNTILLFGCNATHGWNCGVFGGVWDIVAGTSHWSRSGLPILK